MILHKVNNKETHLHFVVILLYVLQSKFIYLMEKYYLKFNFHFIFYLPHLGAS